MNVGAARSLVSSVELVDSWFLTPPQNKRTVRALTLTLLSFVGVVVGVGGVFVVA